MSNETTTSQYLDVPPDPERVIEGLRDTGYNFNTAVADIIDNAIAASASNIDIRVAMDFSGKVLVSIGDDGTGMTEEGLINAMRYGSVRRDDAASLGKFGLGLKTASTAFCRALSAISRGHENDTVRKATWDLDHIANADKWELLFKEASAEEIRLLDDVAAGGTGTLILWEKVDRLLKSYAQPDGKYAKKALKKYEDDLSFHVSTLYQRFLDADDSRARTVTICINGKKVPPWDPYCLEEVKVPVAEHVQDVQVGDSETASFTIRVFILPRSDDFSDQSLAKQARLSNDMQGIYVYRENRLIHGPDWLGMYRKEPHLTLCRVELSFDHKLDDAFQVDIKKSRILLDEALYEWMGKFLAGPRREAQTIYRKGVIKSVSEAATVLHASSNNAIHAKADDLKSARIEEVDGASGNVTIKNKLGTTKLTIKLVEQKNTGEYHVQAEDSLQDGVLWEPAFIDGNQAVRINSGHPYYHKVYMPNKQSGVMVQGLDSLMWGLSVAELGNVSDSNRRNFEEMRYEVSKVLRRLVEALPEPEEDEA